MRFQLISTLLLALSFAAGQARAHTIQQQLEQLALQNEYFATRAMVRNQWPVRGMQGLVADLLRKQRALADALGSFQGKSEELASCLKHADPKVRTLALGAIFMREDAHDLPLIASLLGDISPTFDDIENVPDRFGPPAKADYAHPQSVGDVARAMISYYLDSGGAQVQNSQTELEGEETTSGLPGAFKRILEGTKRPPELRQLAFGQASTRNSGTNAATGRMRTRCRARPCRN